MINLKVADYLNHKVDLPPIGHQRRIASILTTLDEEIEATEALITKHQQIKAGLMHDLFTRGLWTQAELDRGDHKGLPCESTAKEGQLRPPPEEAPGLYQETPLGLIPKEWSFGTLAEFLNGRPKNGYSPQEVSEWSGLLALGLGCLTREGFSPHHLKKVSANCSACHDALLADGDLLISRSNTRELVGLCGIYRDVGSPCVYPDLMMRIRPNDRTSSGYLEELLLSPLMRKQITGSAVGTSGSMVKLNSRSVLGLEIAMPSIREQDGILEVIGIQRSAIETQTTHLAKLRQQKQGLMHDLLTGRVRVALPGCSCK
jgi:type I restriction enzyme, S subunit